MESSGDYELLEDDDDRAKFAEWLALEEEDVVTAVDGGSFGRPISSSSLSQGYKKVGETCDAPFPWRQGSVTEVRSFYLHKAGTAIGHIDCLTVDTEKVGGLVGWISFVYIVPFQRGRGAGRAMVDLAFRSFPSGMHVYCAVMQSSARAKHFYETLGFACVGLGTHESADGFPADVMEKRREALERQATGTHA
eukprot:TRINITY_DN94370_c0_g1_i1.p1 TRINITY_DN94370_c0_g1~~TRINITY_DN94370_c0_g1_i1.p1  ORF type:complete len:193 (-),score=17.70 TRINITY_DN94370_c0_g1_i1:291-869(-)